MKKKEKDKNKLEKLTAPEVKNPFKPKQSIKQIVSNIEERRLNAEELAQQMINRTPERKSLFFREELDTEKAKHIKWLGI